MAEFTKTGTKYDTESAQDDTPTQIKIGGATEKFVPNINTSKWDNECWLNINHPDVVNSEKETFIDDTMELEIGNNTHRYYIDEKGHLEYEIILKEKPISNKVELNLDFPEGLDFWYQPALTQEEIDAGDKRPDNVIGSYAVYWKNSWNQYKTGKFCHIYRPKITDASNHWEWCILEYKNKQLIITIDQSYLDNAVYPITLDPNFGFTSEGGSSTFVDGAGSSLVGELGAAPATATYTEIHIYMSEDLAGIDWAGVVYAESGGEPVARVAFTATQGTVAGVTFTEYSLAITAALTATNTYFAGFCQELDDISVAYDNAGATGTGFEMRFNAADDWATGPSPWTDTLQRSDRRISAWLVYSAAGGSAPTGAIHGALYGPLGGPV